MKMPLLRPKYKSKKWILEEDYDLLDYRIPAGFSSDLDSVPRLPYAYLWLKDFARASALLHDYLYTGVVPRNLADKEFLRAMKLEGVDLVRRGMLYFGTRLFGWISYKPYRVWVKRKLGLQQN